MGFIKEFLFGIDNQQYAAIHSDVEKANRRELIAVSLLGTVILLVLGLSTFITDIDRSFRVLYFVFAGITACIFGLTLFIKETQSSAINIACFLLMLELLGFGMFIGILDTPDSASTVFVVLMLAVPLLFAMRPIYVDLLIVFMTVIFVIVESVVKVKDVFTLDLINGITFCIISFFIGSFTMRSKLLRFVAEKEKNELMDVIHSESITDKMTGLGNRKLYEDNFNKYQTVPKGRDFVYVSIDLNGLKVANDTLGHEAGDELIKGCADCMRKCFAGYGNLYRIGGDEFVAVLFVDNNQYAKLYEDFLDTVEQWHGDIVDELSVAIGAASIKDYPDTPVNELSKIADKLMYADKGRHYKTKGVDRRGRQEAHMVICSLYTKILKVDLKEDIFQIVNVDPSEQVEEKGYSDTISGWFTNFANKGFVHPEDKAEFLEKTSLDYIKDYFAQNKTALVIFYRRLIGDKFHQVMMEMVPCDTYSEHNQTVFLYVKNIDKC